MQPYFIVRDRSEVYEGDPDASLTGYLSCDLVILGKRVDRLDRLIPRCRVSGKILEQTIYEKILVAYGFAIFDSEEDAYTHWLKETAPLDACFDYSDQGKFKKDVGTIAAGSIVKLNQDGTVSAAYKNEVAVGIAMGAMSYYSPVMVNLNTSLNHPIPLFRGKGSAQAKKSQQPFRRAGRG